MIIRRILAVTFALLPFGLSASFAAEETSLLTSTTVIDQKISQKKADIDAVDKQLSAESANLDRLQQKRAALQREIRDKEAEKNQSKIALDKQYARLLDDPETDLTPFQYEYRESWEELKKIRANQLNNNQELTESEIKLSHIKQKKARLTDEYDELMESHIEARVKRINAELHTGDILETSFTTICSTTMTLKECADQGTYLTKQKAVEAFKSQLLEKLTESTLAKQNVEGVQFNIHIENNQIISSGFSGSSSYNTHLQAQLQAKPERVAACKLLNVAAKYCFKDQGTIQSKKSQQWVNVIVRSNQYNDSVNINGVSYGNTPVNITLPVGHHQFTVSKPGFKTYRRLVTINGSDTIWVKLLPGQEG